MPEVTTKLEPTLHEVIDGHVQGRPIQDLGRITIAGYVDLTYINLRQNSNWPLPLFLLDGEEAAEARDDGHGGKHRTFYVAYEQLLRRSVTEIVTVPQESKEAPWVYLGNGTYPSEARVHFFEPPIAYDQQTFDAAVRLAQTEYLQSHANAHGTAE